MAGYINSSIKKLTGGVNAVAAVSQVSRFSVLGTWITNNKYTINLTYTQSGLTVTIGEGVVTGLTPAFVFTHKRKMNVLCGTSWAISGIDKPNRFNDFNLAGRGVIDLADYYASPSASLAIGPYQGKLVPFGNQSTQVWAVAPPLEEYDNLQVLDNTGTIAKLSVQAWGELDLYFLDETGVRSLRTRETSLNAVLNDIGSPLDIAIQAKLAECNVTEKAAACGIVDPMSGRYMLFIKDTIYVLSNFPAAGIQAWATYKATYQATDVMTFFQDVGGPYTVKIGMVNDHTKAFYSIASVYNTTVAIVPGEYIFVTDVDNVLVYSSAIPGGVTFRGAITIPLLVGTFVFTSNQTAFVPQKFLAHKKQVLARAADAFYSYGGLTGSDYDNAVASAKIPWLDIGVRKVSEGINASITGSWYIYASMDYLTTQFTECLRAQSSSTYDGGVIPFSSNGSHFSMQAVSNAASRALVSALNFNYK